MNRGFVTLQFLMALLISMFFFQSLLGLTLTLTHATLVQYITYSSARRLSLGSLSKSYQIGSAREKYQELREKFFKQKYQNQQEWFSIPRDPEIGFNDSYADSPQEYRRMFYGVFVPFTSRVFNFQFPLLTDEPNRNLSTQVASYLGREPSEKECSLFFKEMRGAVCRAYGLESCGGATEEARASNGC